MGKPRAELVSLEELAETLRASEGPPSPRLRSKGSRKRKFRRSALAVAAIVILAGAGTAAAVVQQVLTTTPVTAGFSALDDPGLLGPTDTSPAGRSALGLFRDLGPGPYEIKQVGDGMYLARRGDVLCEVVLEGAGGCTDQLDGDVWLFGDFLRAHPRAIGEVHLYGFARDDVVEIRVTTTDGVSRNLDVEHNAFQIRLVDTTFDDVTAIEVVRSGGNVSSLDPRRYFPRIGDLPATARPNKR
jgi:hypothetical protein